MGKFLNKVMGTDSGVTLDDYISVDFSDEGIDAETEIEQSGVSIHVANIRTNQDLLDVKDALYAGDIVIADISRTEGGLTRDRVENRLAECANDVNGDIARKDSSEVLITPTGVSISRSRIGK